TSHADHLVTDQIRGHADQMQAAAALANDLVTSGKRDQMREALERHALTVVHMLRDRIGKGDQRHWVLLDHGLRLLTHVLRQIIEGANRLAGTARAFPAAEGLVTP